MVLYTDRHTHHTDMASSPFASSSATASTSRLRHRHEALEEAVQNGAYLARPPTSLSARRKGKERERLRSTIIPGLKIGSKGWVREGFRLFGEHCARNQVRRLTLGKAFLRNALTTDTDLVDRLSGHDEPVLPGIVDIFTKALLDLSLYSGLLGRAHTQQSSDTGKDRKPFGVTAQLAAAR